MNFRSLYSTLMQCFCRTPCMCALSRIAFCPKRSSYNFENVDGILRCIPHSIANRPYFDRYKDHYLCSYATNSKGYKIAYILIHLFVNPHCTIIYSHGNSCDIGMIFKSTMKSAEDLSCNILIYDYSGYGMSTGSPSEETMYLDIEAIWNTLTQDYGIPADEIVLHGHSIGTVASVDLASKYQVKGVILQSALESGMKVVCPRHSGDYDVNFFPTIFEFDSPRGELKDYNKDKMLLLILS